MGFRGDSHASKSTTMIEPKTNHRDQLRRRSGSGSQSTSFRARIVTSRIGPKNQTYHGAPQWLKRWRKELSTETPTIPSAKSAAKVTLRPRQARQNQLSPENGFTVRDRAVPAANVKMIAHDTWAVADVRTGSGRTASTVTNRHPAPPHAAFRTLRR